MQDFYAALVYVDTDNESWVVTVRGVLVTVSLDVFATFLGIKRSHSAYPAVEVADLVPTEEVFKILSGQKEYMISSSMN